MLFHLLLSYDYTIMGPIPSIRRLHQPVGWSGLRVKDFKFMPYCVKIGVSEVLWHTGHFRSSRLLEVLSKYSSIKSLAVHLTRIGPPPHLHTLV